MSERINPWPTCPDPEYYFARALLLCGPLPPKGWSVTRTPSRKARYVTPRGREALAFQKRVLEMFTRDITEQYAERRYTPRHYGNMARRWKNQLYLWIWEKLDEDD